RYRFGEFVVDPQLFQLQRGDAPVEISRQAFELLRYLIEERDRVVSRAELLEQLWADRTVSDNAVSQVVIAARRAIGDGANRPHRIERVYGRGFQFIGPVEVEGEIEPPEEPAAPEAVPAPGVDDRLAAKRRELASRFGPLLSDLCGELYPLRLFASPRP